MFNAKFRIATNGDIYQNKFEKKYTEKFCYLYKNVSRCLLFYVTITKIYLTLLLRYKIK